MSDMPVLQEPVPPPAPVQPEVRLAPRAWARANLFGTWPNSALTVVFGLGMGYVAFRAVRFVLVTADWEIVRRNLLNFMVGRFPRDQLWRPWAAMYVLAGTIGFATGAAAAVAAAERAAAGREPDRSGWAAWLGRFWPLVGLAVALVGFTRTVVPALLLAGVAFTLVLARTGGRRLPAPFLRFAWIPVVVGLVLAFQALVAFGGVGWERWGGLLLTSFVTVAGIALAFPLGVLFALGRRSTTLPAVRAVSIGYIEFVRGVPLLALLLMGQFIIGFFLPSGFERPSFLTRALVAIVLFEAAYIAEIVRGGLQAVPRGQFEAAQALGLSPPKVMRLVVLPQALRAVIPAMVGQFISLYKDTSLLGILGLFEILQVAQTITSQADFLGQGLHAVTLAFVGLIYWVGSFTMSRESQRLERRLGVGER